MALGLWATLSGRADLGGLWGLVLSAVGVSAWGVERLRPLRFRGANVTRLGGGAILGLALGGLLGRHFVEPWAPGVVRQIVLIVVLAAGFGLVDLLARPTVRKTRDCDENRSPGAGAP